MRKNEMLEKIRVREENKIRNEKIKEMYANGIIMKNI